MSSEKVSKVLYVLFLLIFVLLRCTLLEFFYFSLLEELLSKEIETSLDVTSQNGLEKLATFKEVYLKRCG